MTITMENFGLCVIITKPCLSYREVAEVCVECGIKYLQLREKNLDDREILEAAEQVMSVTYGTDTKFIMNDRADLALLAGADMLHLGQGDITLEDARLIVGQEMAIGLSTHSLAQAHEALAQSPDYIGFGPIYATTTKACPDPTVGTELLGEVLQFADVPVIAIGGLFPENIDTVLERGAKSICLVRHLMESTTKDELTERIKALQAKL